MRLEHEATPEKRNWQAKIALPITVPLPALVFVHDVLENWYLRSSLTKGAIVRGYLYKQGLPHEALVKTMRIDMPNKCTCSDQIKCALFNWNKATLHYKAIKNSSQFRTTQ